MLSQPLCSLIGHVTTNLRHSMILFGIWRLNR